MCSSGDWGCSPTSSFAAGRAVKKKQCAHGHPACEFYPEFVIITKERTEGGLNKGAYLLPLYSNHFWFFRIEQSRVLYGDSITPFTIIRLSHSFFQQGGLIGFSSFQGRRPLSPDKTRLIPLYTTMIRRYCYIDILAEDRVHSTWYHHTLDIS